MDSHSADSIADTMLSCSLRKLHSKHVITPSSCSREYLSYVHDQYKSQNISTDVSIRLADGTTTRAHSAILTRESPVILRMLTSGLSESASYELDFTRYDKQDVLDVLDYVYTAEITLTPDNVERILSIAHFYDIATLVSECSKYICDAISDDTVWDILNFADTYLIDHAIDACNRYISANVGRLFDSEQFLELPIARLLPILTYRHLEVTPTDEWHKRVAVARIRGLLHYVSRDEKNRAEHINATVLTDTCKIPPHSRSVIRSTYPYQQLSDLFDAESVEDEFEIYSLERSIKSSVVMPYTMRFEHPLDPSEYDNVVAYGHVCGVTIYMSICSTTRMTQLCCMIISYSTGIERMIGSVPPNTCVYFMYKFTLAANERIMDVKVNIVDKKISSMLFIDNFGKLYGHYGILLPNLLLTPVSCRQSPNAYLHAILYAEQSTSTDTTEINDTGMLIFRWIRND